MNPESKELLAFTEFCKIRGLEVERFEERCPPEPDIYAVVGRHGIAYELTEAVEPDFARQVSDPSRMPNMVRNSYAALSPEKKNILENKHYGKVIDLCFLEGVSQRNRENSLPEIFDFLISIPAAFGSTGLERLDKPNGDMLAYISMGQIGWEGIHWESSPPFMWIDSETALVNRLIDKMENKQYRSEAPIDLIVYLEREPDPSPGTEWVGRLRNVASSMLSESPFRAVWLLNMWTDSVYLLAGCK